MDSSNSFGSNSPFNYSSMEMNEGENQNSSKDRPPTPLNLPYPLLDNILRGTSDELPIAMASKKRSRNLMVDEERVEDILSQSKRTCSSVTLPFTCC